MLNVKFCEPPSLSGADPERLFYFLTQNRKEEDVMLTGLCPLCDARIQLEADVLPGELVECPECAMELEVVSAHPLRLAEAPQEEEDWGE